MYSKLEVPESISADGDTSEKTVVTALPQTALAENLPQKKQSLKAKKSKVILKYVKQTGGVISSWLSRQLSETAEAYTQVYANGYGMVAMEMGM